MEVQRAQVGNLGEEDLSGGSELEAGGRSSHRSLSSGNTILILGALGSHCRSLSRKVTDAASLERKATPAALQGREGEGLEPWGQPQ